MQEKRIFLCLITDVPEKQPVCITAENRFFAVYRSDDGFIVIRDECPHQMASFEGCPNSSGKITCGFHGWVFDLKSGVAEKGFGKLFHYPVQVVDGKIYADLSQEETDSAYSASFVR
ncbi:MAG: Rieske 2Fe-2S domain-containing protein [Bacteroidetes bacterium]|nr:Rieske 2Fe-2S domain-containing protein [Bacteroidota bacterium]